MLKRNLFKGTISVSVLYATIALFLLFVIYFTESGKQMAEGSKFPFIISFTIGMLVIIAFLIYNVVTFKTVSVQRDAYDDTVCPDYWKLQKTPEISLSSFTTPEQKVGKDLQCYWDRSGSNIPTNLGELIINKQDTNLTTSNKILSEYAYSLYGSNSEVYESGVKNENKVKIVCSNIYPKTMSSLDISNYPEEQNVLRCAYATSCGLTWSAVCPSSST
jgi:hypothetical protein